MNEKTLEQLAEELFKKAQAHANTFKNVTEKEKYLMRVVYQDAYGQAQSDNQSELARLQAENAALKEAQRWVPVEEYPGGNTWVIRWHQLWECPIMVKRLGGVWIEKTLTTKWPEQAFTPYYQFPQQPLTPATPGK